MNTNAAVIDSANVKNGVNVDTVINVIETIQAEPAAAQMQFRVQNNWINGGLNRSRIQGFYAACAEDETRSEPFTVDSDEPAIMAGEDSAPNAMEFVLHGLAGCLTSTLIYHAAVQGIEIEVVESHLEGDMDARGLLGLDDNVRKGYSQVRVGMRVKSQADEKELTALALHSPVYDIVSNSLPVEFKLETY